MTRAQWTLAGILALQVLILLAIALGGEETGAAQARPLFPELAQGEPASIEIAGGEDDAGESLRIELTDGVWRLPGRDGFPADPKKMDELLGDLEELEVRRPVVSGSRYHKALEVDEDKYVRRVRVADADGNKLAELWLGNSPNYQVSDVRAGDDDRVYEVRGLSSWDLNPDAASWIDTRLIDVPLDDVVEVRVENRKGRFELRRDVDDDAAGKWQLTGGDAAGTLDDSKVDSFVRSLASLRISEPAGRKSDVERGFDHPSARVELVHRIISSEGDREATETVTLLLGSELSEPAEEGGEPEPSGQYFATRSDFEFAVVLGKWDAEKIVDETPADLVK